MAHTLLAVIKELLMAFLYAEGTSPQPGNKEFAVCLFVFTNSDSPALSFKVILLQNCPVHRCTWKLRPLSTSSPLSTPSTHGVPFCFCRAAEYCSSDVDAVIPVSMSEHDLEG